MTPVRVAAVQALAAVLDGEDLDAAVAAARAQAGEAAGPLLQALVYGVLRHYRELQARRTALLSAPGRLASRPPALVMALALYELAELATPAHAVVHEAVEAVRALGAGWASGLVNAVLRRAQREGLRPLGADAREEYPPWLQRRIAAEWGDQAPALFAAGLERAPLSLRVNRLRMPRDDYLARLASESVPARPGQHAPDSVILETPRPVAALPGFAEGTVSVQDEAAQLAAELLDPRPGERILDACAAPGGKTCHIAERCPEAAALVAVDRDPGRLARVRANLERLGLAAETLCGDAGEPHAWWDGQAFARILLDAPCTATGVMRRHPDIRIARRAGDAERAARRQARLLGALWPLLDRGGRLVYATCSILEMENDAVVERFAAATADARVTRIAAAWGRATRCGRRIRTGEAGMDGFYYAVIIKR